jgi:hypothetical protein
MFISFLFWNHSNCDQYTGVSATDSCKRTLIRNYSKQSAGMKNFKAEHLLYSTIQGSLLFKRTECMLAFSGLHFRTSRYTKILWCHSKDRGRWGSISRTLMNTVVTRQLLPLWQLGIGSLLKIHTASSFIIIRVISYVKSRTIQLVTHTPVGMECSTVQSSKKKRCYTNQLMFYC